MDPECPNSRLLCAEYHDYICIGKVRFPLLMGHLFVMHALNYSQKYIVYSCTHALFGIYNLLCNQGNCSRDF